MEPKRTAPEPNPNQSCMIAWCDASHRAEVRDLRSKTHRRSLATSTGSGMRLNVDLVQMADQHGFPTEPPHVVLCVVQEDKNIRVEPFPPGLLKLDQRRASDLARMLTAACGPHWLAETLERGVRLMLEADRTGGLS